MQRLSSLTANRPCLRTRPPLQKATRARLPSSGWDVGKITSYIRGPFRIDIMPLCPSTQAIHGPFRIDIMPLYSTTLTQALAEDGSSAAHDHHGSPLAGTAAAPVAAKVAPKRASKGGKASNEAGDSLFVDMSYCNLCQPKLPKPVHI